MPHIGAEKPRRRLKDYRQAGRASQVELVDAGVSGFVHKGASPRDFLATIRLVAGGGKVPSFSPGPITAKKSASLSRRRATDKAFGLVRLTMREREVFSLIAAGLGEQQIAHKLHIGIRTIARHVKRIQREISTLP